MAEVEESTRRKRAEDEPSSTSTSRQIANLHSMLKSNKRLDVQKLKFLVEPKGNGVSIDVEFRANVNFSTD